MPKSNLTDSEVATILCALRNQQRSKRSGCNCGPGCDHFEDAPPLDDDSIEALCEKINFDMLFVELGDPAPLSPHSLRQRELAEIVEAIQTRLYLDETVPMLGPIPKPDDPKPVEFWNHDRQWDCVEDLSFVGDILHQHGLVPSPAPRREASDVLKVQL